MKSLSSSLMNKKTFASILAVLSIVGYGVFVFAQPFTPGETTDPGCGPLDLTCTIIQAWEQDIANNLVFNNTTSIGIGVDDSDFGFGGLLTEGVHINGELLMTTKDSLDNVLSYKRGDISSIFGPNAFGFFQGGYFDTQSQFYEFLTYDTVGGDQAYGVGFFGPDASSNFVLAPAVVSLGLSTLSSNNDGNGTPLVIQVRDENSRGGGFSARTRNLSSAYAGADMFVWDDAFGGDRTAILMTEVAIDSYLYHDANILFFGNVTKNNVDEISFNFHQNSPIPSTNSNFVINQNFTWSKPSTIGTIMSLEGTTGDLTIAGTLTQNSDERLKSNIENLSYGIDSINLLKPVSYTLNISGAPQLGFIAQEVQGVLPELVNDSKEYLSLNYIGMIPVLTKAIQELDLKLSIIESQTIVGGGFSLNLLFTSLQEWLGNVGNGIEKIFAREIETERLCVKKSDGTSVCVTGDQLEQALGGQVSGGNSSGGANESQDEIFDNNQDEEVSPEIVEETAQENVQDDSQEDQVSETEPESSEEVTTE